MSKLNLTNLFINLFFLFNLIFIADLSLEFCIILFGVGLICSFLKDKIEIKNEKYNKVINFVSFCLLWFVPFNGVLGLIWLIIFYSGYIITDKNYCLKNKRNGYIIILFIIALCYGSNSLIYSLFRSNEVPLIFDKLVYAISLFIGSLFVVFLNAKKAIKEEEMPSDSWFSIGSNIIIGLFIIYQLFIFKDLSNYCLLLFFSGLIISFFINFDKNKKSIFLLIFAMLFLSLMILNKNGILTYIIYLLLGLMYGLIGFNYQSKHTDYNIFNIIIILIFILLKYSDINLIQSDQFMIVFKIIYCIVSSVCFLLSYNKYIYKLSIELKK